MMKFCDIVSRVVSTVVLCVVWVPIGYGQIKVWKSPSSNNPIVTSQWEVNDLVYKVKRKVEKPFLKEVFARVEEDKKNNVYHCFIMETTNGFSDIPVQR